MIRILHIVGSVERAGIETFLMNLYRCINREEFQFDFMIYNTPTAGSYRDEIEAMGGRIYQVTPKEKGLVANYNAVRDIVRDNDYKIVWRHCEDAARGTDLIAAKAGGATVRLLHAHSTNSTGLSRILHYPLRFIVNAYATGRLACGKRAGRWMFGHRPYELVYNGIDTESFKPAPDVRRQYRDDFSIGDSIVIGHVGRFENVKNHAFLIKVFAEYKSRYGNAKLLLVGDGVLKEQCMELARECQISEDVIFAGLREDIPELLSAMDVFVLPSIYEGFPVTLIEAQAAGLPCIVSDSVSPETDIYGGVSYIGLDRSYTEWAELVHSRTGVRYDDGFTRVANAGYDMNDIVAKLMNRLSSDKER